MDSWWSSSRYKLFRTFQYDSLNKCPIDALAVSDNCKLLAASGGKGIRVWDIETKDLVPTPPQNPMFIGLVSCILWLPVRPRTEQSIIYGTAGGVIAVWDRKDIKSGFQECCSGRVKTGTEVMCLDAAEVSADRVRIAIGQRAFSVAITDYDIRLSSFQVVCNVNTGATVPRAVRFMSSAPRDFVVLGFYDGKMLTFRGDGSEMLTIKRVTALIGYASFEPAGRYFVVDNTSTGFDLHQSDTGGIVKSYPTPPATVIRPKQVVFGERATIVIGGSDHGIVYVYDRSTAKELQRLRHAGNRMVQTIASAQAAERSIIATATSDNKGKATIKLWAFRTTPRTSALDWGGATFPEPLEKVITFLILLAGSLWVAALSVTYFTRNNPTLVAEMKTILRSILQTVLRGTVHYAELVLQIVQPEANASDNSMGRPAEYTPAARPTANALMVVA